MKVTRELEAHHITDKNGKRTVVWKKPAVSSTSKLKSVKPILMSKPSDERIDDEQLIERRLSDFNADRLLERKPSIQTRLIDIAVAKSSDEEVAAIAKALDSGDKVLAEMIFHTGVKNSNLDDVMGVIAVYEPYMHEGLSPRARQVCISTELESAHKALYGHFPEEPWNLIGESESTRQQAKQFVQVWHAILQDHEPDDRDTDVLNRALSSSAEELGPLLDIVRGNPTATVAQINFILSGGESAMSSGML